MSDAPYNPFELARNPENTVDINPGSNPETGNTSNDESKPEAEKSGKGRMRERPILFLDLETTGLNPGFQEISEIGAVLVSQPDWQVIRTYEAKVLPSHIETAQPEALVISHFDAAV